MPGSGSCAWPYPRSEVQRIRLSGSHLVVWTSALFSSWTSGGLPFLSPFEQPSQPAGGVFEDGCRRPIRSTSFATQQGRRIECPRTKPSRYELKIRDNINALRSEKEKVDSILRCMVEGLVVIDPKGKVLLVNEQAKKMFGVTEDQIRTAVCRNIPQPRYAFSCSKRCWNSTLRTIPTRRGYRSKMEGGLGSLP